MSNQLINLNVIFVLFKLIELDQSLLFKLIEQDELVMSFQVINLNLS